jgi:hypothetical protein
VPTVGSTASPTKMNKISSIVVAATINLWMAGRDDDGSLVIEPILDPVPPSVVA